MAPLTRNDKAGIGKSNNYPPGPVPVVITLTAVAVLYIIPVK